jgi:hypothetical protein
MPHTSCPRTAGIMRWMVALFLLPLAVACRHDVRPKGHGIAGRVVDSRGLALGAPGHTAGWEEGVPKLTVGREEGDSFLSRSVRLGPDGTFVTHPLAPGMYVLEVQAASQSQTAGASAEGGIAVVSLGASDIADVEIRTQPIVDVAGRFRMESDNPSARWPSSAVAVATLALDGTRIGGSGMSTKGGPGGTFVIRALPGPRLVRCGYSPFADSMWWEKAVLLDGVDITNVPTDFTGKQNSRLEVVFTQHPSRFTGTVTGANGQAVAHAWVVVFSADRLLWQRWSTTSRAVKAEANGRFSVIAPPGRYLVRAFPPESLSSERTALRDFEALSRGAETVELEDREAKRLALTSANRRRKAARATPS